MEILLRVKRNGKGTEQEFQPATNMYVQLFVWIGNSWKNSQNSFCTGNPALRPVGTNCSWHSSSKAFKCECADSQHTSLLNLFRCTHTGSIHLEPLSGWQQGQTPAISWTRTVPKRTSGWSWEQQKQKWNHLLWLYPAPGPEQHTALGWGSWFLLSPYDPANNHCICHECAVRG